MCKLCQIPVCVWTKLWWFSISFYFACLFVFYIFVFISAWFQLISLFLILSVLVLTLHFSLLCKVLLLCGCHTVGSSEQNNAECKDFVWRYADVSFSQRAHQCLPRLVLPRLRKTKTRDISCIISSYFGLQTKQRPEWSSLCPFSNTGTCWQILRLMAKSLRHSMPSPNKLCWIYKVR